MAQKGAKINLWEKVDLIFWVFANKFLCIVGELAGQSVVVAVALGVSDK